VGSSTPSNSQTHTLTPTAVKQTAYEISQYSQHFRVALTTLSHSLSALHMRSRREQRPQNTGMCPCPFLRLFRSPPSFSSSAAEVHFTGWVNMYSSSLLLPYQVFSFIFLVQLFLLFSRSPLSFGWAPFMPSLVWSGVLCIFYKCLVKFVWHFRRGRRHPTSHHPLRAIIRSRRAVNLKREGKREAVGGAICLQTWGKANKRKVPTPRTTGKLEKAEKHFRMKLIFSVTKSGRVQGKPRGMM